MKHVSHAHERKQKCEIQQAHLGDGDDDHQK